MQRPAARGTAYGFEVRSDLPLAHLRNGEGQPLEVVASSIETRPARADKLLMEWTPAVNGYSARLYSHDPGYLLWVGGCGWFEIDAAAGHITVPEGKPLAKVEEKLWGIPALLCFIQRGDHALHATAVETNGGATLLLGDSALRYRAAAAFASGGQRVLSQDMSCLRLGAAVGLVPGPALLRVPKNTLTEIDMSTGNGTWKGSAEHYCLDATRRGTCKPIPVRAAILLQASEGSQGLEQIEPAQAISELWSMSFRLPTEDDRARCFEGVADLAANVPVARMNVDMAMDPHAAIDRIGTASLEFA